MVQYTHGHHASVLQSHATRTATDSAAYLLPHLRAGQCVLDVGCGPGTITLDLATRVAPGRVVGVDSAAVAVEAAREGAAAPVGRIGGDVSFEVADCHALPFDDGEFDVVHAHQVLQHLADPVAALREMSRVCRPGGLIAARDADYAAFSWFPAVEGLSRWLAVYRAIAHGNGAEPDAGRRLRSWARAAGLVDVRPSGSVWVYADPPSTAWWGSMWARRVTESAYAEQALTRGLADAAELAQIAQAWRDWAEHPDAWFAVPHGELIASPAP